MRVRTDRHLAYNYKSFSTMQHFLTRAFRLPALVATLFGITLCGQVLAQTPKTLSTLMYFDGVGPQGGLITDGGNFFGAASGGGYAPGGLLYRLAVDSSSVATIYEYGRLDVWTGANPGGALTLSGGYLYGVTQNNAIDILRGGSPVGAGTVFRVARDGSGYTKLFDFDALVRDFRGYLINTSGSPPQAQLIEGVEAGVPYFYGTTFQGGIDGTGTVFKIRTDGSGYQVLHHFGAAYIKNPGSTEYYDFDTNPDARLKNADGVNPNQRLLLASDGKLYGVVTNGGTNGTGVVFWLDVDGTDFGSVSFDISPPNITDSADTARYGKLKTNVSGGYPAGGLVQASDGMIYGTASGLGGYAGASGDPAVDGYGQGGGYGTVFRINPASPQTITPLRSFTGSEVDLPTTPIPVTSTPGAAPAGDLIVATDGMLVGTTQGGGLVTDLATSGTVFKMSLDGTQHIQECIFTQVNAALHGATPISGVIQAGDGGFFGIAYQGGYGGGLIFKCGAPHGAPPLGVRPPYDDGDGSLTWWMVAVLGSLLAVQIARRKRRLR